MTEELSDMRCRMYEQEYPSVDDIVIVKVKSLAEMGAYVSLLEYNDIEGMILFSELSRRRIRSVSKLIRVGRMEVVSVLRVDREKGYIDLSKKRVQSEDVAEAEAKWNKSKMVHSIMRYVAKKTGRDALELYEIIGWPLTRRYGHAYDAFKLFVSDTDVLLPGMAELPPNVLKELSANVCKRLSPQEVKIRADIEVACFEYEGIDAVKEALRSGLALSTTEHEVNIRLVAPPLYVVTTSSMDADQGIEHLTEVVDAIQQCIERHNGTFVLKSKPRAVTDRDDHVLLSLMERLERENQEVGGDEEGQE